MTNTDRNHDLQFKLIRLRPRGVNCRYIYSCTNITIYPSVILHGHGKLSYVKLSWGKLSYDKLSWGKLSRYPRYYL